MSKLHVACLQVNHDDNLARNLDTLAEQMRAAAAKGAQFIVTPECSDVMVWPTQKRLDSAQEQASHEALAHLQSLAKELGVWLVIGSLVVHDPDIEKLRNRSYMIDDQGKIAAQYDKIHLFDAQFEHGETYRESAHYAPGDRAVSVQTPWAKIGMSICYDLRFAHLYRKLAHDGAQIMVVPAAFAVTTGCAHWEVLLRARAIETGSFVLASGQTGSHPGDRSTYGHSMIIGPWGGILAKIGDEVGFIDAIIDLKDVETCRTNLPAIHHDRNFTG